MKSMLKTQFENEGDPNSSALQGFAEVTPKLPKDVNFRARDSGYVTDFSPASATSPLTPRQFRFDSDLDEYDTDVGLEEEMDKIAICDDVFHFEQDDSIDTGEFLCDSDDREVEEFFSDSGELGQYNSVTQPVEITPLRPGAPVPTPIDCSEDPFNDSSDSTNSDVNNDSTDYSISHSYHHTPWNVPSRRCQRHMFRPISRSVGTQTPSPVSQLLTEAIGVQGDNSRFQPYRLLQRGSGRTRPRFQSDSEEDGSEGPLPDVVPYHRDRSVSLPEVQALRLHSEQQVGRELRRISDEFHSSFHRVRPRRGILHHAASFPLSFDLTVYWNSIRRYLSPEPSNQDRSQRESQWQ